MTLQEYLVNLGFHVEEASFRRFLSSVRQAESGVTALGAETVAAAGAIVAAVEKVASTYEDLYYLSQRTERSVSYLQTYGLAARQVGLSAGEARGSIEGFYHALRTNPGLAGLAAGLGAGSPEQLASGMKARGTSYLVAHQIAALFGQDEITFKKYWDNAERFVAFQREYNSLMRSAGLDTDEAKNKFYEFTTESHRLAASLEVLGTRIALDLEPTAKAVVTWLNEMTKGFLEGGEAARQLGTAVAVAVLSFGKLAIPAGVWEALKLIEKIEAKRAEGLTGTVDRERIAQMDPGRRMAIWVQEHVFGADPRQFSSTNEKDQIPEGDAMKRAFGSTAGRFSDRFGSWDKSSTPGLAGTQGMNAEFVDRLNAMRNAMPEGMGFTLNSGLRSREEQARLYANRGSNSYPVAPPGNSDHEKGTAGDFRFFNKASEDWVHTHGGEFGTQFPYANDPIHGRFNPTLGPTSTGGSGVNINQKTDIHVSGGDATATGAAVAGQQRDVNARLVRSAGDQLQ